LRRVIIVHIGQRICNHIWREKWENILDDIIFEFGQDIAGDNIRISLSADFRLNSDRACVNPFYVSAEAG